MRVSGQAVGLVALVLAQLCALGTASRIGAQRGPKKDHLDPLPVSDKEILDLSRRLFMLQDQALSRRVSLCADTRDCKAYSSSTTRQCRKPLLTGDVSDLWSDEATIVGTLYRLYNEYIPDTTEREPQSRERTRLQDALLDKLLATTVLNDTLNFLTEKRLAPSSRAGRKDLLRTLWFQMYSRDWNFRDRLSSSGFEHVFLGEVVPPNRQTTDFTVGGMHSWLYYLREEQNGRAEYFGWIKKHERVPPLGGTVVLSRFNWRNAVKYKGSMLVGTSPEIEISLYTLCFLTRLKQDCRVHESLHITTVAKNVKGTNVVCTAYPEIKSPAGQSATKGSSAEIISPPADCWAVP